MESGNQKEKQQECELIVYIKETVDNTQEREKIIKEHKASQGHKSGDCGTGAFYARIAVGAIERTGMELPDMFRKNK